jgi:hypothetical protein
MNGHRRGTRTFSARWDVDVLERLDSRSEAAGASKSKLAERYVDEGLRMEAHPGIVFRGGPSGRRAALIGGPDVWEVISFIKSLDEDGQVAIDKTAELLNLSVPQVRTATRYFADFREEVNRRIEQNAEQARAAEAAWRRERAALA